MKKGLLIALALYFSLVSPVKAADLDLAMVRPSRLETGVSPLPILVVIKTNSGVVENGFRLNIGSAWTVGSGVSLSTTQMPSGITAWPGISYQTTSAQTIIFSSGDLVAGTTYGMYLTGGVSNNGPVGNGAENKWMLSTLVDGLVDSQMEVKVPILTTDQIVVTGRVGARASDFSLETASNSDGRQLVQNEEVEYTLTYGSLLQQSVKPLVLTAEWSRGTINSQPGLLVDIAEYVIGSGSTAWGGVSPVIDLVNRTITWTISTFPAETLGQTVSFKLRTTPNFTGTDLVNFRVSSQMNVANVLTVGGGGIDEVYKYYQIVTPTSTPTPGLTSTPVPSATPTGVVATNVTTTLTPTATPTVKPKVADFRVTGLSVVNLESDLAELEITTNQIGTDLRLKWGTNWGKPTREIKVIGLSRVSRVVIDGLTAETRYYFSLGQEWYTLQTPRRVVEKVVVIKDKLLVVSGDRVMWDGEEIGQEVPVVVIPKSKAYSVKLYLNRPDLVSHMQLWVRNRHVLGIVSAYEGLPNESVSDLYSLGRGGFMADFQSPRSPGWYEYYLRIYDFRGGISEQKLGEVRVTEPLLIVDAQGKGIERVKLEFDYKDVYLKNYRLLPGSIRYPNPTYSESNGEVDMVLAEGEYRVRTTVIGYESEEMEFRIDKNLVSYPQIVLKGKIWNLVDYYQYYRTAFWDVFGYVKNSLGHLTLSNRFFQLVSLGVIILLTMMAWILFSLRVRMPWWVVIGYLLFRIKRRFLNMSRLGADGVVVNVMTGYPVVGAEIYVIEDKTNKILEKLVTNIYGSFLIKKNPKIDKYRFMIMAKNFETKAFVEYDQMALAPGNIKWKLKPNEGRYNGIVGKMVMLLVSRLFEIMLFISLLLEIAMIWVLGWMVVPLFLVSLLNLGLLFDYWWKKGQIK